MATSLRIPASPSCPPVGRHFAADKAHLLRQVRTCAGGIELDFVAHRPTQQFVGPAGQPLSRTGPTAPGRHRRWYSSPGRRIPRSKGVALSIWSWISLISLTHLPSIKRLRCFSTIKQPISPAVDTAKPVCPLSASTSQSACPAR